MAKYAVLKLRRKHRFPFVRNNISDVFKKRNQTSFFCPVKKLTSINTIYSSVKYLFVE